MRGKVTYLAIAATLGIISLKYQFHFIAVLLSVFYFFYLSIYKKYFLLFSAIIIFFIFSLYFHLSEINNGSNLGAGEYKSQAMLGGEFFLDGDFFRGILIDQTGEKLSFTYYIKTYEEKLNIEKLQPGQQCYFQGELEKPKLPTMPNAFNYREYLFNQKIHWRAKLNSISACHKQDKGIMTVLQKIRKNGLMLIEKYYPESSRGIVQALIFGERSLIADEVETAYKELGIVHLLAISGLHVGLLVGGLYYFFIRIGLTHTRTRLLLICFLPAYIVLTGGAPSVTRASVMVIIYFLLRIFKWRVSPADIISMTYLLMLLLNPYELFHIGFQLSFLVSFILIISSKIIVHSHSWFMRSSLITIFSQLGAAPILFYHFHEISILSLPMNLIFVPFYSFLVLPLALMTFCLQLLHIGSLFIHFLDIIISYSHHFVQFSASFKLFTLAFGKPGILILFLYVSSILFFFIQFERAASMKEKVRSFVPLLFIFMLHFLVPFLNPYGKIMAIDVGQGDSILIQQPFKRGTYLIDTGGKLNFSEKGEWAERNKKFSIAKDITIPYLKSIGVTKIDLLFLTHGDTDHIGEVSHLLDGMKVKEIILPIGFIRGDLEKEIIKKAIEKRVKITVVKRGDYIKKNGLRFDVLSPEKLTESKNDDSLVLYSKIGGLSWLFTGDLEHQGEEEIIRKYDSLTADVLKVGHHGSKGSTSDEFLNKIKPSIGIVSAGYNNRYNHPHKDVVEKLKERDIPLFRTDIQGAIMYEYKGNRGTFLIHPPYDTVREEDE
ncbi:DNA internalization-related competence protein ComEC/Rec2 [Metabacillus fastidiosus]|uniref:DNA internalization-related competence protein ComEC/Rec2 n=1 Tax=Metabacillus fastidiosus TaxID=1458 RepID=UPI002E1A3C98|nr:DNA internalization-related competence protein ComEC/Rec2 [Metabacillus fastidiosus]MED4453420.1 DNA internalization-related competence protein ComEC/Rec2 [Metabacillus fastidiosus]